MLDTSTLHEAHVGRIGSFAPVSQKMYYLRNRWIPIRIDRDIGPDTFWVTKIFQVTQIVNIYIKPRPSDNYYD